ncbi:MAG: hypothetical protein ACJ77C_06300 [Chloroflexota bacterium]
MATSQDEWVVFNGQALAAELPEDFEDPEALAASSLDAMDQRPLNEGTDNFGDRISGQGGIRTDSLRGVDLETIGEDRKPREEAALLDREELVAPVDRGLHRSLMRMVTAVARTEQLHLSAHAFAQGVDPQRVQSHGGQLQGEWQAIELATQLEHGRRAVRIEREALPTRRRPLDEQRHGVRAPGLTA